MNSLLSPMLRLLAASPLLMLAAGAAQAQQDPPQRCQYDNFVTLPLKYTGAALKLTTDGTINRAPATFLVSTATQDIVLTRSGATRHRLEWYPVRQMAHGIGGHTRIYRSRLKELTVGPGQALDVNMKILGDFGFPASYDGIAGAHLLFQSDLEFDLAGKKIRFFRQYNCQNTFLAYWDPNAYVVPYDNGYADHRNPRFTVMLNGVKLRAAISSADPTTSVTVAAAKRAGLKFDAPGVERADPTRGVGGGEVKRWTAVFDTLEIGAETVRKAKIAVIDSDDINFDLILGADFLRTHRVLFAKSQRRLYISYLGGEPFEHSHRLEPWIQKEADEGNAHAQMALADMYLHGRGAPRDADQARTWLEKAGANGNARANFFLADSLMQQGRHGQAATKLLAVLNAAPGARDAALLLYAARMNSSMTDLAGRGLNESFARDDDEWPGPIAQYYRDKITEAELLEQAQDDSDNARAHTCEARRHIAERIDFERKSALAAAAREKWRAACDIQAQKP